MALHKVDAMAADIRNRYLQAPTSENHFVICDADINGIENAGKQAMVGRALNCSKLVGRGFWMHMRACMDTLGFISCFAYSDAWIRKSKLGDGTAYYEYVILYVDDFLVISENAENVIRDDIRKYFELKQESIKPLDMYLGVHMRQVTLDNVMKAWAFGSSQ